MWSHCCFLILASLFICAYAGDPGVLHLGDSTFDKFVDGTRDVFVKFDKEDPSGPTHDAFKDLAIEVSESRSSMLIVSVPINNAKHNKLNQKLAKRYGLNKLQDADFPRFKLFKKGNKDTKHPLDFFDSDHATVITTAAMRRWTMEHTGARIESSGKVRQLDDLASSFMAAPAAERQQILQQAHAAAEEIDSSDDPDIPDHIQYYLKTMQKVLDKGDRHVRKETKRLKKMVKDKSTPPVKRDMFRWRLNVLASFAAAAKKVEL